MDVVPIVREPDEVDDRRGAESDDVSDHKAKEEGSGSIVEPDSPDPEDSQLRSPRDHHAKGVVSGAV